MKLLDFLFWGMLLSSGARGISKAFFIASVEIAFILEAAASDYIRYAFIRISQNYIRIVKAVIAKVLHGADAHCLLEDAAEIEFINTAKLA